jgi:hypothetical protein
MILDKQTRRLFISPQRAVKELESNRADTCLVIVDASDRT